MILTGYVARVRVHMVAFIVVALKKHVIWGLLGVFGVLEEELPGLVSMGTLLEIVKLNVNRSVG